MLDIEFNETIINRLNNLLAGKFIFYEIEERSAIMDGFGGSMSKCFNIYLRTCGPVKKLCEILVINFRVFSVSGEICIHEIEWLNKAFIKIKEMEHIDTELIEIEVRKKNREVQLCDANIA